MAKHILIDATHSEETRVVVNKGNRLEDFDFETLSRKQLKGNIYLARVTRVEPSLQAAFVEYGGNRHGFLPFSEIHPDYYRIPTADRAALDALENGVPESTSQNMSADSEPEGDSPEKDPPGDSDKPKSAEGQAPDREEAIQESVEDTDHSSGDKTALVSVTLEDTGIPEDSEGDVIEELVGERAIDSLNEDGDESEDDANDDEDRLRKAKRLRFLRQYRIQEVIRRKQILLVQVTKEERGNKGAALTTYLSLAGRYSVLMPNTNKGGGISRKINSATDRKRLKDILSELDIPDGIAVIVRTAGSQRNKMEIRRDYEYLIRLWNDIRETTFTSEAPALIYEEADLIKRTIRDLYTSDMDGVLVEGEKGYRSAKNFMRMLMPSHAKKVQRYKEPQVPLFHRFQVESQIDAMHNPSVQLKSGGYIVINPTEALVAIDVNSGRATRERNIEETAFKTNLEAAEEVARQLRLRDLAGLVVVDFIDMEDNKHNREVERRLKDAMSADRARIQMGRISPFGLLEMSRQRLRPSLAENSTVICPHCAGIGNVRTVESAALHVLRILEEDGIRRGSGSLDLDVAPQVALFILNQKRSKLIEIEQRYGFEISVNADENLKVDQHHLERVVQHNDGPVSELMTFDEPDTESQDKRRKKPKSKTCEKDHPEREKDTQGNGGQEPGSDEVSAKDEESEERPRRRRRGKRGGRKRGGRKHDDHTTENTKESTEDASVPEKTNRRRVRTRPKTVGESQETEQQTQPDTDEAKTTPRVRREMPSGGKATADDRDNTPEASLQETEKLAVTQETPAAPVEAPEPAEAPEEAPEPKKRRRRFGWWKREEPN